MLPSVFTLVGVLVPVPDDLLSALGSAEGVGCLEDDATGWAIELEVPAE
jgi:hypothetical protein